MSGEIKRLFNTKNKTHLHNIDTQQVYFWVSVILFVVIGLLVAVSYAEETVSYQIPENTQQALVPAVLAPDVFEDIDIQARTGVVYLPEEDKIIFSKNHTKQLPLASVTKLMTATIVANHTTPDEIIKFKDRQFHAHDLISYMLVASSNEVAQTLKKHLAKKGIDISAASNELAMQLGLSQSYFLNPSGLDESDFQAGAYGSAYDVARLLSFAYASHPDILESTTYPEITIYDNQNKPLHAENTNKITRKLSGFVAGKTGYTLLAGGNLAVVVEPGGSERAVIVVLGSSKQGRFDDVLTLFNTYKQWLKFYK